MKRLMHTISFFVLMLSAVLYVHIRSERTLALFVPRLLAAAFAPFLTLLGGMLFIYGWLSRDRISLFAGAISTSLAGNYVQRVLSVQGDFVAAFGKDRDAKLPVQLKTKFQAKRWQWRQPTPEGICVERDVVFATIETPDGKREVLCDMWQPPDGVQASGLGLIYLHGSGWHYGTKDFGTRHFFSLLAAQGHVVMDVDYRMTPEVLIRDMIGDVKRAITWLKANAAAYGINPDCIVTSGGSAGGHLALLAAYTPEELNPVELIGSDLSVRGVISYYGVPDLAAFYRYGKAHFKALRFEDMQQMMKLSKFMAEAVNFPQAQVITEGPLSPGGMVEATIGGRPEDLPGWYAMASPITHVTENSPPTLLLQGSYDMGVTPESVRELRDKLQQHGVPVVHVEYPYTEHAFDLLLPQFSPVAQSAFYEVERFLALLVADAQEQ